MMSRMIPATIHPDVKSAAEKRIFRLLRDAPGTDDWVVLHSLGLARHQTKRRGEIDSPHTIDQEPACDDQDRHPGQCKQKLRDSPLVLRLAPGLQPIHDYAHGGQRRRRRRNEQPGPEQDREEVFVSESE